MIWLFDSGRSRPMSSTASTIVKIVLVYIAIGLLTYFGRSHWIGE